MLVTHSQYAKLNSFKNKNESSRKHDHATFTRSIHVVPENIIISWERPILTGLETQLGSLRSLSLCCLIAPCFSTMSGHSVSCMTMLYSVIVNHQIRHQTTSEKESQTGDCRWSFSIFLKNLCGYVWFNILTLSLLRAGSFKNHCTIVDTINNTVWTRK